MGQRISRRPSWEHYSLLITAVIHLFLPMQWGDDAWFFTRAAAVDLPTFLSTSSRLFVDSTTYLFATWPMLWRLLNPLVLFGLYWLFTRLLGTTSQRQNICIGLGVVLLSMALVDAGFMATTINYLWPTTFALFLIYSLLHFVPHQKVSWLRIALCVPALFYAMNMQQMALVLPALLAALLLLQVLKNKQVGKSIATAVFLVCALAGAAFSFFQSTGGEASRLVRESARYFPDFASLSILQRAELGFSSTMHGLSASLSIPAALFLLFCVFLVIMAFRQSARRHVKVASLLPITVTTTLLCLQAQLPLVNYGMRHASYLFSPVTFAAFVLLACATAFAVFLLLSPQDRLLAFYVLGLGVGSRILMGFSPTVWASGVRTFYLLLLSMLFVGYQIYRNMKENTHEPHHPCKKTL